MTVDPKNQPQLLGEETSPEQARARLERARQEKPTALVHILTPEFQGFEPGEFDDIPDEVVERASAQELQAFLFWPYVRKDKRQQPEVSAFSYITPRDGVISVALTPEEYTTASESVEKLAQRRFAGVLTQRDVALREEKGDETVRAREDEDLRVAWRGAVRAVMNRQGDMEELLQEKIIPKIELIEKFIEMTQGRNPNLARGTSESVRKRFEELRTTVFDDMLDAVALQKDWSAEFTARAKRVIQKRLYVSGTSRQRVANFQEMLTLALEYYGHKRAMMLTKIQEAKKYQQDKSEVVADIITVDEQRRAAKAAKQLQIEDIA